MSKVNDGGPAFPPSVAEIQGFGTNSCDFGLPDMSLRDYFAAHAPRRTPPWFDAVMPTPKPAPVYLCSGSSRHAEGCYFDACGATNTEERATWDREHQKQISIQWPYAWADVMLAERDKWR